MIYRKTVDNPYDCYNLISILSFVNSHTGGTVQPSILAPLFKQGGPTFLEPYRCVTIYFGTFVSRNDLCQIRNGENIASLWAYILRDCHLLVPPDSRAPFKALLRDIGSEFESHRFVFFPSNLQARGSLHLSKTRGDWIVLDGAI